MKKHFKFLALLALAICYYACDDILEEDYVFISEWDSESTDDTGENVQQLSGTIEFMVFMDKSEEALVHWLSNHFSSGNKLGIKFMEDVFEVVSLNRFFWIEKLQKLLDKLWGNVNFEWSNFNSLVDNKL